MFFDYLGLVLGLAVLTLGAEGLVRGSASLAVRVGVPPLIIGLTVVAFGTSAPELVVSLVATLRNQSAIALGNVVGSNIFNIGIILGLAALICPIKVNVQVIRHDGPIMVAASLMLFGLCLTDTISRWNGVGLFLALMVYLTYNVWMTRNETSTEIDQQFSEGVPQKLKSWYSDVLFLTAGLAFLVLGSRVLVSSATDIARALGLSEAVIGLTIIAAGTSLPELATSVVAALRKQPDIAIGNIIGSNIFNIFAILGISAMVKPLPISGITSLDLWVMLFFALALLPMLYSRLRLERWEGGLLFVGYAIYLRVLWPQG